MNTERIAALNKQLAYTKHRLEVATRRRSRHDINYFNRLIDKIEKELAKEESMASTEPVATGPSEPDPVGPDNSEPEPAPFDGDESDESKFRRRKGGRK